MKHLYASEKLTIAFREVTHVERQTGTSRFAIVTRGTTYDYESGQYNNCPIVEKDVADDFMSAWNDWLEEVHKLEHHEILNDTLCKADEVELKGVASLNTDRETIERVENGYHKERPDFKYKDFAQLTQDLNWHTITASKEDGVLRMWVDGEEVELVAKTTEVKAPTRFTHPIYSERVGLTSTELEQIVIDREAQGFSIRVNGNRIMHIDLRDIIRFRDAKSPTKSVFSRDDIFDMFKDDMKEEDIWAVVNIWKNNKKK